MNMSRIMTIRNSMARIALCVAVLAANPVLAATYYWDGTSASWNTAANWSTASGATTPDPATVPSALDGAIFNITTANGAETITLDADQAVDAITFNNTGTTTLTGGGTDRTLTLGTGGITIASGAGAVTLGDGTAGNNVLLSLATGAQTWINNTATAFTLNNTVPTFTRATGATLTFNKASTGNFAISTNVLPKVNSIAGPWAFFVTGTSQKYAVSGATITGLTGTDAPNVNSINTATANYEYTATGTTYAGVPTLGANTIRTSLANTIALSSSGYGPIDLPLNGILAVGASGTFTISQGSRSSTTKSLQIGNTGELVIAGQQAVTLSAPIYEGLGAGRRVIYSGTSTLTLSGVNTYTGGTTINSGTLKLGTNGTLGNGGPLTLSGGTLNLNTTSKTAGAVSVIAAAASGDTISNGSITGTSYAASNATGDAIISANLLVNGTAGFTKSGEGTVTLSGTNTYTGGSVISKGTLALGATGSISDSTFIAVASNAVFDVSACTTTFTLAASQTLTNSAPGAIISGASDCTAGTLSMVYDGVNPCFIQTNGTLTLSAYTTYKLTNTGTALTNGTYTLIQKTAAGTPGSVAGSFEGITVTVAGNGAASLATLSVADGQLLLTIGSDKIAPSVTVTVGSYVYNGSPQGPTTYTTSPTGDLGTATWSYVGVSPTSYGPSSTLPMEVGQYTATVSLAAYENFYAVESQPTPFTISWPDNSSVLWVADSEQPWSTTAAWDKNALPTGTSLAVFNKSNPLYAPSVTADASVGALVFSNATTFGSGSATLSLGNASPGGVGIWMDENAGAVDLGGAKIALQADQCWQNNSAGDLTIRGEVSGAFNITNSGPGKVTLTAVNTFTGVTVIESGTLEVQGHIGNSSSISNNASLIINNGATRTYGMVIRGSGTLTKTNTATLTLTGNSTYSGGTALAGGTLVVGHNNALGTGDLVFNGIGRGFQLNNGVTVTNNITIGSNEGIAGTGLIRVGDGATATVSGTITLNSGASGGGHFGGTGAAGTGILNLTGPVNSSVNVSQRSGIVVFWGGGSYTAVSVGENTIRLGADNGLCTNATLSIGGSGAAYFDLAGYDQTLVGIKKSAQAATIGNSSTTSDSTLTTTGTSITNACLIQDTLGSGTRKVGLTVNGGSLTLIATNTYTGPTTVSAGTLVLATNNAISVATAVTLGSGTLDAQTYSNAVSTLTVTGNGTLNLGTGGKLVFADSASLSSSWTGTVTITGDFVKGSSIRFGESSSALTSDQLTKITTPSGLGVSLNEDGFLIYRRGTIIEFL